MTTYDLLTGAWDTLTAEGNVRPGIYERRLPSQSGLAVFAGLSLPTALIRLSISVSSSVNTDGLESETKGYRVVRLFNQKDKTMLVSLELNKPTFKEIFKTVAADVAKNLLATTNELDAVTALQGRLNHWQNFMQACGPDGLTKEEQIGLFGELTFFQSALQTGIPAPVVLAAWKGPSGANQDFQANGHALEVKTTLRNSPTRVKITNELQLDESMFDSIALFHLWLGEQPGSLHTLPLLVDKIRQALAEPLANEFTDRLIQVGYHDVHKPIYSQTAYFERARSYYKIEGEFPRIRKGELRPGVGEVSYTIDLSGFGSLQATQDYIIKRIMVNPNV